MRLTCSCEDCTLLNLGVLTLKLFGTDLAHTFRGHTPQNYTSVTAKNSKKPHLHYITSRKLSTLFNHPNL